ncbi:unnamed protein product [Sphagnum jensenii]|uniref:Uncharacterized protein n=1 Tax=Sphagnum jensenii TaxID=128206 RepID=A0ABP1BAC8_9BRYO
MKMFAHKAAIELGSQKKGPPGKGREEERGEREREVTVSKMVQRKAKELLASTIDDLVSEYKICTEPTKIRLFTAVPVMTCTSQEEEGGGGLVVYFASSNK